MDEQIQSSGVSQPTAMSDFDLSVGSIISNGFSLGFKYFFPLLISYILWAITLWIPYINIGTTIGLYGLIVKMSKGEKFSAGEIFKKEYRAIMPEFLLLTGLFGIALYFALLFVVIPGIVLSIAWGYSFYFLIDKKLGVLESLRVSNETTYGKKWDIFGGMFIIYLIGLVVTLIIWLIFRVRPDDYNEFGSGIGVFGLSSPSPFGVILLIIVWIIMAAVIYGAEAYVYRELSKKIS